MVNPAAREVGNQPRCSCHGSLPRTPRTARQNLQFAAKEKILNFREHKLRVHRQFQARRQGGNCMRRLGELRVATLLLWVEDSGGHEYDHWAQVDCCGQGPLLSRFLAGIEQQADAGTIEVPHPFATICGAASRILLPLSSWASSLLRHRHCADRSLRGAANKVLHKGLEEQEQFNRQPRKARCDHPVKNPGLERKLAERNKAIAGSVRSARVVHDIFHSGN